MSEIEFNEFRNILLAFPVVLVLGAITFVFLVRYFKERDELEMPLGTECPNCHQMTYQVVGSGYEYAPHDRECTNCGHWEHVLYP